MIVQFSGSSQYLHAGSTFVIRPPAIAHNTNSAGCGSFLGRWPVSFSASWLGYPRLDGKLVVFGSGNDLNRFRIIILIEP